MGLPTELPKSHDRVNQLKDDRCAKVQDQNANRGTICHISGSFRYKVNVLRQPVEMVPEEAERDAEGQFKYQIDQAQRDVDSQQTRR